MAAVRRAALVTGADRGLGRSIALQLAASGWAVVVHSLAQGDGEHEVVEQIEAAGGRAQAVCADLAQSRAVADLGDEAGAAFGGLDVLVHAAFVGMSRSLADISPDEWQRSFAVNLKARFLLSLRVARDMEAGGLIAELCDAGRAQSIFDAVPREGAAILSRGLSRALPNGVRSICISIAPEVAAGGNDDIGGLITGLASDRRMPSGSIVRLGC